MSESQESLWRPAIFLFVLLSVMTGLAYPFLITGVSQVMMPRMANGQLIEKDNQIVGSALIAQQFTQIKYFWGRPSATGPMAYNAALSGGSNLGPTNPLLIDAVRARVQALREADPSNTAVVPVDLVTTSASGLDPHISRAAADYQISRVARARHMDVEKVQALVNQSTEGAILGILGEPRVNVLLLNLALDARAAHD